MQTINRLAQGACVLRPVLNPIISPEALTVGSLHRCVNGSRLSVSAARKLPFRNALGRRSCKDLPLVAGGFLLKRKPEAKSDPAIAIDKRSISIY
jgi:hypothetical protein